MLCVIYNKISTKMENYMIFTPTLFAINFWIFGGILCWKQSCGARSPEALVGYQQHVVQVNSTINCIRFIINHDLQLEVTLHRKKCIIYRPAIRCRRWWFSCC